MFRPRSQTLTALLLSLIAALSAAQATGVMPSFVSADNNLTLQLSLAPTNTEPSSATGTIQLDLQSGNTKIELKNATPNSAYLILFVSTSTSTQLGTMNTNASGEASLDVTLDAGTYVGVFQVTRGGILQFLSVDSTFTVTATGSVSSTQTTTSSSDTSISTQTTSTETETSATASESVTGILRLQVDPPLRTISAGAFAKFDINIQTSGTAHILLTARSVPPQSVAIFTQGLGVADPEFHSTLTVLTSIDTPAGTYGITLITLVNGREYDSQIGLEVTASSTSSQTASTAVGGSLSIDLSTDQRSYQPNATVTIQGHVTDDSGNAVADASVSVQVDGPTGAEIVFLTSLKTDAAGVFQATFALPASSTAGTYTAFTTANKNGFDRATTHTTFVVGTSSTPSAIIKDVYATDASGARSAVFSVGQTIQVWVVVQNSGAPIDQGRVWVQILDPRGAPIYVFTFISTLGTGQTVTISFGFTVTANMGLGLYKANALVSDKLISEGGTFLASGNTDFALTD